MVAQTIVDKGDNHTTVVKGPPPDKSGRASAGDV